MEEDKNRREKIYTNGYSILLDMQTYALAKGQITPFWYKIDFTQSFQFIRMYGWINYMMNKIFEGAMIMQQVLAEVFCWVTQLNEVKQLTFQISNVIIHWRNYILYFYKTIVNRDVKNVSVQLDFIAMTWDLDKYKMHIKSIVWQLVNTGT